MSGIYIHIPYCKSRCTYCDFYTQTNLLNMDEYVNVICKELFLQKNFFQDADPIKTIYFGGGTPSLLSISHIYKIFEAIQKNFHLETQEITFEVNPDDISHLYAKDLFKTPINRISMGVQAFQDDQLCAINRRHSAIQAETSIRTLQDTGFTNISVDLIYGLPDQTLNQWKKNVEKLLTYDIPHISAYHLIYEPNTKLFVDLKKGIITEVSEELSIQMYEFLVDRLREASYEHYEISNFAKNQLYSQHNSSYWLEKPYLGVGVSAHSFDGTVRFYNPPSLSNYMKSVSEGVLFANKEVLNKSEKYNEFVFTRLRTMWGLKLDDLMVKFGEKYFNYFNSIAEQHLRDHNLLSNDGVIKIPEGNMLISDKIMSDFMYVEE